jgi:glutamate synthase (NADPH/NADH) small chain
VFGAVALIERIKTQGGPLPEGVAHAVVVGGGNTAIDIARELKHLRVPEVTLIYRREESAMSAYAHEQASAKTEGVRFLHGHQPVAFKGPGRLQTVTLVRMRDDGGRLVQVPHSETELPCDMAVLAVGQGRLQELCTAFPGVEFKNGRLVVDPVTGGTGHPKVFGGGDLANGGKEVVNATAEGKLAARTMDRLLQA